ncbi:hypothetical protein F4809DRAFT_642901 [Biscogniauxia mediterranea]|nr:hypothetical protein F4809DRAFT_642901 [Biscogniauxia mediterranea]
MQNVEGRFALRWAVRATAYADFSQSQEDDTLASQVPDDHDFMTVVILDIFERALDNETLSIGDILGTLRLVKELRKLDQEAVSWREGPRWWFKTLAARDLPSFRNLMQPLTDTIQLHTDIWMAYGWNYHRTAKIVAHGQVLECINTALAPPDLDNATIKTLCALLQEPTAIIRALADEILSTMPQSLGDIDHPTKVKETQSSTKTQQRQKSQVVFERIREYTGMKSHLGEMNTI